MVTSHPLKVLASFLAALRALASSGAGMLIEVVSRFILHGLLFNKSQ
jgi:hypothetical protein